MTASFPPIGTWLARRFEQGKAPAQEWLVDKIVPMHSAGILAAPGGTGKGMLMLELALKVAGPPTIPPPTMMGREIKQRGGAVVLCGQDGEDEVHRRLEALDPMYRRGAMPALCVIPVPALGFPLLMTELRDGQSVPSRVFQEMEQELKRVPDLRLVVFDPLVSFTRADFVNDTVEASVVMSMFAGLAARRRCAVVITHHLSKIKGGIRDAQAARDAVKGSGTLVDEVRWCYVLWPLVKDEALRVQKTYATDERQRKTTVDPDTWYGGSLVKTNQLGDPEVAIWQRHPTTRRLEICLEEDRIQRVRAARVMLLEAVDAAWQADKPYQRVSRVDGLWARRQELPAQLRALGQRQLIELADELLERGELGQSRPAGGSQRYLRVATADVTPLGRRRQAGED